MHFHAVLILHYPGATATRNGGRTFHSQERAPKILLVLQVENLRVNRVTLDTNSTRLETLHLERVVLALEVKFSLSPLDTTDKPYCAMYNLTQGRYVAPFVILTLQGLTLELKEGNNGRVHHGTTIQAGVFTIHL